MVDVSVKDKPLDCCIFFELFANQFPKIEEKFCSLNTEERGVGYKGSSFHRIITGSICQGGDFTYHNKQVHLWWKFQPAHTSILSVANAKKNTNAGQFVICTNKQAHELWEHKR